MSVVVYDLNNTRDQFELAVRRVGQRGATTAFRRALNHEGRKGRTAVRRTLRKQTSIPRSEINAGVVLRPARGQNLTMSLYGFGSPLGLVHFNPRQFGYGTRAKVWGEMKRFNSAFIVDSLAGNVFVRTSASRLPIKKLFGPGIAREIRRDEAHEAWEEAVQQIPQRAMHELRRIMAG